MVSRQAFGWIVVLISGLAVLTSFSAMPIFAQSTATPDLVLTRDAIDRQLTQQATLLGTVQPSPTSPLSALTPVVGLTPLPTLPTFVEIPPPPLTISVPADWPRYFFARPSADTLTSGTYLRVAVYTGTVAPDVTGSIYVLWDFSMVRQRPTTVPFPGTPTVTLPATPGSDPEVQARQINALRLLQGTVTHVSCNVGHYGIRNDLSVGALPAVSEVFTASQCTGEPDTVGWYSALKPFDKEFVIYVLIEPASAFNDYAGAMKQLVDTIQFVSPAQQTLTPQPSATSRPTAAP